MKRWIVLLLVISVSFGFSIKSFASDWDVAGKVLTGIAGLRILTGGKVDIVGNVAGIQNKSYAARREHPKYDYRDNKHCKRVWVPRVTWKKKWIPAHREYDPRFGEIIVEGHYIKYKIERGGYWDYGCGNDTGRPHHSH